MQILKEVWRPIPGEEEYMVSSLGRVSNLMPDKHDNQSNNTIMYTGKIKVTTLRDGYPRVKLRGKAYTVHRLVAAAFLGPCPDGMEVRHLDGNKLNNRADNLAYGTHSENILDIYNTRGYLTGMTREQALTAAQRIIEGDKTHDIATDLSISVDVVYKMRSGKNYRWAFEQLDTSA